MSPIIGIDLGTTFSAIGIVQNGVPQIVATQGERIMPSVVGLSPQGNLLVGTPARNQYVLYPDRTIRSIKRSMGSDTPVVLGERSMTAPQVSALILRELKRRAEATLGVAVERAVITVPAYFSDAARQATREAGELAGLIVERIINEPTAAALAYGLDRSDQRQLVAVYDLGGGTFDVSIVELDSGVVEVRASHGNTKLGGDDFDALLCEHLATLFQQEHQLDLRQDRRAMARLLHAAEQAKIELSTQPMVRISEEYLITSQSGPLHLHVEIQREEFEGLIATLLEGTIESFDAALHDAQIDVEQLEHILLVGGSTRIPLVWEMLRNHTGIEPSANVNPDEAVALGAAVQGAIIAGEPLDAILVDLTPHSLGIEVAERYLDQIIPGQYSILIHRNTTIPAARAEIYSAVHPSQTAIALKIFQGEHPIAAQNTLLGEFLFDQLQAETPGEPPRIVVTFNVDVNGMVQVTAVDRGSGKQAHTTVKASRVSLAPNEIISARSELEEIESYEWEEDQSDDTVFEGEYQEVAPQTNMPPSAPIVLNLETIALLNRARRVQLAHSQDQVLRHAIADVEAAARQNDSIALATSSETLLDLLYELDEE
jgi:molecular chaperone DnaK